MAQAEGRCQSATLLRLYRFTSAESSTKLTRFVLLLQVEEINAWLSRRLILIRSPYLILFILQAGCGWSASSLKVLLWHDGDAGDERAISRRLQIFVFIAATFLLYFRASKSVLA